MPQEPGQNENNDTSLTLNPELHEMEDFFDRRLQTDPQKPSGILISTDFLGNTVYTSQNKTEDTMAGIEPASLIATKEGKDIVIKNPGLLRQIKTGVIPFDGIEFSDGVYQIELDTSLGRRKYVMKYIPYENGVDQKRHMSGIEAMRLMQIASDEKPVKNLRYAVPIMATHDFYIAPLINEGFGINSLLHYIKARPDTLSQIEDEWSHPPQTIEILKKLREEYQKTQEGEEFINDLDQEIEWVSGILTTWINSTIEKSDEFKRFHLGPDVSESQFVIDMGKVMDLYKSYRSKPEEWRVGDGFSEELMKILGIVELAGASKEKAG